MRKIFNKMAIILTTSSLTFPLTACVFDFYADAATDAVIQSFANQTSSVLKALAMSNEESIDTTQAIYDILEEYPNSSIKNQTAKMIRNSNEEQIFENIDLSTWEEFANLWGLNGNIRTRGFSPSDYFGASKEGTLTQQVNSNRNINNILNQAGLISGLNVADNEVVYNLIKDGAVKDTIVGFLNDTKETDPNSASMITKLLKNAIVGQNWNEGDPKAFIKNIVDPLTSILNNLIKGQWDNEKTPTPTNIDEFKTFMNNWKDSDGDPYSQWNDGTTWNLEEEYYKNWNLSHPQSDFNFYRGGVLVNYLFYKIGKDYNLYSSQENKKGYLGDIITENLTGDLMGTLNKYIDHLLDNPVYILIIVDAVVPIIKQWALNMSDISQPINEITFGEKYKTDDANHSYNARNILENLQKLIENPEEIKYVIESLLGLHGSVPGGSFTYDIKIADYPLPGLYDVPGLGTIVKTEVDKLVVTIMDLLESINLKSIFDNILDIYDKWIKQYNDKNNGISFDLTKLYDFLLSDTNGLIKAITEDVIPILYEIMTNTKPITDEEYLEFYEGLGGKRPPLDGGPIPKEFKENSALELIKNNIADPNEPLGQLILILIGNSSDGINGLFSFIIDSNNQWIDDNYAKYFDVSNKSAGHVSNATMTTQETSTTISNTLTYDFTYKINGVTYSFRVECKSNDNKDDFTGTKNFYFTNIQLRSRK